MPLGVRALLIWGFGTWRKNLILLLPFVFRVILIFAAFSAATIPFVLLGVIQIDEETLQIEEGTEQGLFKLQPTEEMANGMMAILLIVALAAGLAALAIFSYFEAGAIGMAREVLEKGSTSLETMWSVGRSHYLKMAAVYLIIWPLSIVLALVMIGIYFFIVVPLTAINEPLFLLIWGLTVLVILITLGLSFITAPFALVIYGLGPLQAVGKSIEFFISHKAKVFIVVLAFLGLSLVVDAMGLVFTGSQYGVLAWSIIKGFLDQVIISSLLTVWLAGLYMDRTGKLLYEEAA